MSDLEIERHERVVTIRLPGLHVLNALNHEMLSQVLDVLRPLDADPEVGCFVVVGPHKPFEADALARGMAEATAPAMAMEDSSPGWEEFARLPTPKVAAVDGHALGAGCELAMMCDVIVAGESAVFGQPEIKLGVIPGIASTQRLPRLVGRAKAMDLILTGRLMGAREAERCGLVSRVVADGQVLAEAAHVASTIASYRGAAVTAARERVDQALEPGLRDGTRFEGLWKLPQQRRPHFGS